MNHYDKQLLDALKNSKCKYVVWYTGSKDQADYIIKYSKKLNADAIALPLPDNVIKGQSKILSKKFLEYFFLDFPDIIIAERLHLDRLPIMG